MNESYWIIRTASPQSLLQSGEATGKIAQQLRLNARLLKQTARTLIENGVPLRRILLPYVDTVLLDERTPAYFFGGRILVQSAEPVPTALRPEGLTVSATDSVHLRTALAASGPRPSVPNGTFVPVELVQYRFDGGKPNPMALPIQIRAQSRAVLAFGDILGRVIAKAGGEILCCAENRLICAWPNGEPDTIRETVCATYQTQLAPVLGNPSVCRRVWGKAE